MESDYESYAACDIHERAYLADYPCPWCERDEALARLATLEAERDASRWLVMEELAAAFQSDAKMAEEGAVFQGGPLDGANIYNVNARTARKIRELIDAEHRAATQEKTTEEKNGSRHFTKEAIAEGRFPEHTGPDGPMYSKRTEDGDGENGQ